jgi:leucyl aminopeptidase (aminopeptidase T)
MRKSRLTGLTDILVRDYCCYDGGSLTVIADDITEDIGRTIAYSANMLETKIRKSVAVINLDNWRNGEPLIEIPESLSESLNSGMNADGANISLLIFHKMHGEGEMVSQLIKICEDAGKVGRIPECSQRALSTALHSKHDPGFSDKLRDLMLRESEMLITCTRGTRLKVKSNRRHVKGNESLKLGKCYDLLPANIIVQPVDVNGEIIISRMYEPLSCHKSFRNDYRRLARKLDIYPVRLDIEKGNIVDVGCRNKKIMDFVKEEIFDKDPVNGRKVSLVSLPANLYAIKKKSAGSMATSKIGRVYIAHGDSESGVFGECFIESASLFSARLKKFFMKNNEYSNEVFSTVG